MPRLKQGTFRQSSSILSINHHRRARKETIESILSSASTSGDEELDEILRLLNELSATIKTGNLDSDSLDDTIEKTAVWAVKQSLLDREIRSLAITDELTGFFNRRGFLAAASQQLRLAHRDMHSVLLLYCDVDNLKFINDTFGHREGDFAIIRAADALEETFRDSDVLARHGGDEFAVLAWEAAIPHKEAMLGRLEKNLAHVQADETRYKLSLSVGVARYDPQAPVPLGELIAAADQDMYQHKVSRGRSAFGNQ